jgi:hypothetical protein
MHCMLVSVLYSNSLGRVFVTLIVGFILEPLRVEYIDFVRQKNVIECHIWTHFWSTYFEGLVPLPL